MTRAQEQMSMAMELLTCGMFIDIGDNPTSEKRLVQSCWEGAGELLDLRDAALNAELDQALDDMTPPSFDAEELEAAIKKGAGAWSEWPGEPDQWGVHPSGKTVAIPAKYHRLAIHKRLSSSEKSAILFETDDHKKHFFLYVGPSDDGRFVYDMPDVTHGDLKVLYTHIWPYPHFFARNFTLAPGSVYSPRFKTVDHRGRTVNDGEAV